jgi:hypothetical protein
MKFHKKTMRAIIMDRKSSLGVTPEGELRVVETPKSYRDLSADVAGASPADRMNVYMEFVKEVGDGASEDTKRKLRKRLGL